MESNLFNLKNVLNISKTHTESKISKNNGRKDSKQLSYQQEKIMH